MIDLLSTYAAKASVLASSDSTAEDTYYGPIMSLLAGLLRELQLPDDVREKPKERRDGGGLDRPDIALYDGTGDFILVPGEVKLPACGMAEAEEVGEMALLELCLAWQVSLIDPCWGRENYLWQVLDEAVSGKATKYHHEPTPAHGLEHDFVY